MRLAIALIAYSVSHTGVVLLEAERLKARGADVADFGPGEPDFPTPEHIKKAAIDALAANRTKYTATAGIAPCVKPSARGTHAAWQWLRTR